MTTKKIEWKPIIFDDKDNNAPHWWSYKRKKLYIPRYYGIRIDWKNKRYTFDDIKDYPTMKKPEILNENNIKNKFQDEKLPLVDEVFEMDIKVREAQTKADTLKAEKNKMSGEIGKLMKDKKIDEANAIKDDIAKMAEEIAKLEKTQEELAKEIKDRMLVIPNIMDPSVPIGKDDTENVEVEKFGEPVVPEYEIPYHADIIDRVNGMDKEAAGRTSGQGFYYFTFNILVGKLLSETERPKFFGFQSSFSYIFGVLAPSISGAIIVRFSELTGYYVLFGATVFVLLMSIFFSMQLKKVESNQSYTIFPVLMEKGNKFWNLNKYVNFTNGFTQAIYGQIFTVFAYLIISNESIIGNLSSTMSLIGVVSSLFIASKVTTPAKQKQFHLYYCFGYLLALGGLGLFASKVSLYIAYIVLGLVTCWYNVIYQNQKYQFSTRAAGKFTQSDYVITTEFPIAAGRISGLVIFYILNTIVGGTIVYRILLVAITLVPFLDHYIVKKVANWLE